MSTTRKIEGIALRHDAMDTYPTFITGRERPIDTELLVDDAVLVIGGKAFTEEEHEAEFQRRAKAMLDAVDKMEQFTGAQIQMLAEYGITLP